MNIAGVTNVNQLTTFSVIVTSNDIINSLPVTLLSAPGIGFAWQVVSASEQYIPNTTAYTNLSISITPTGGNRQFLDANALQSVNTSSLAMFEQELTSADNIIENVEIIADTGGTVGDGSIRITGIARLIKL